MSYLELAKKALVNKNSTIALVGRATDLTQRDAERLHGDKSGLFAWASHLSEQELVLANPVSYAEGELLTVTTVRISFYAAQYLGTISYARLQQETGGWGMFKREWWSARERQALGALANLRQALEKTGGTNL